MPPVPADSDTLHLPPDTSASAAQTLPHPGSPLSTGHPPSPHPSTVVTLDQPSRPSADETLARAGDLSLTSAEGVSPIQVGRFVVRGRLGEGAFGVVYRAHDPQLDRDVALKVAKVGALTTPQRVERFLREARSAARLRHPNIVPLFEAGRAGDDYYIACALIPGDTLEEVARSKRLDFTRAAQVVRHLAEALAYAHGEGIVHRDVKPANVMLDRGQPLLMDFGLAARHDGAERLTHDGTVMGTPLYMAPEAAAGRSGDVGPASDQYSLGILLYELLCGQPPFTGTVEMILTLHQRDVPPSPRRHNPSVPRDLETICLKCLEKEPPKRYADCQALADDLRRWLEGEPIQARRLGVGERLLRWCQREPRLALTSAVAVLALVAVAVIMAFSARAQTDLRWQAVAEAEHARREKQRADGEARRANDKADEARQQSQRAEEAAHKARQESSRAEAEARRARKAAEFLSDLFRVSDPVGFSGTPLRSTHEKGQTLTARQILDKGARQIRDRLKDDPLGRAGLLDTIGDVYRSLGLFKEARPLLEEALALRRKHLGEEHADVATSLFHLGWWHQDTGDVVKAEELYRRALTLRARRLRQTLSAAERREAELAVAECQFNLGFSLALMGEPQAEQLFRACLAARAKHLQPYDVGVAMAKAGLAAVLIDTDRGVEAAKLGLEAMQVVLQTEGVDAKSAFAAVLHFQQGMVSRMFKRYQAAEKSLRKSLEISQRQLGPGHPYNCFILHALGDLLEDQGKDAAAEVEWQKCMAIARRTVGLEHPRAPVLVHSLAELLLRRKRSAEGTALYREMLEAQRTRFGANCPWRRTSLLVAADFEVRRGAIVHGRELLQEALTLPADRTMGRSETLALFNAVGRSFAQRGLFTDAERPLREGLRQLGDRTDVKPAWLRPALEAHLARVEWAAGRRAEAEKLLRAALAGFCRPGMDREDLLWCRGLLAGVLAERGKNVEAAALLEAPPLQEGVAVKRTPIERVRELHLAALLWRAAGDASACRRLTALLVREAGPMQTIEMVVRRARLRLLLEDDWDEKKLAALRSELEVFVKRLPAYTYGRQTLVWSLLRAGKVAEAEPHLKVLAGLPSGKDNPFDELLRAWAAQRKGPTLVTSMALAKMLAGLDRYLGPSAAACQERLVRGWEAMLELRLLAAQVKGDSDAP